MSNKTYSREFLRGYQEMKRLEGEKWRRDEIDSHIDRAAKLVFVEAQSGKTEWSLQLKPKQLKNDTPQELRHLLMSGFASDEIIEGFRRKFPDCDVNVKEDWVETQPGTRELQTRIAVSWK